MDSDYTRLKRTKSEQKNFRLKKMMWKPPAVFSLMKEVIQIFESDSDYVNLIKHQRRETSGKYHFCKYHFMKPSSDF